MTLSWLDRVLEKGERNSRSYDFTEKRPLWRMWVFRLSAAAVCICIALFFWAFL
jgi:hypothetical protein